MTDNLHHLFDRYSPKPPPGNLRPYVAYGLIPPPVNEQVRIDIYRSDGSVFSIEDALLFDVVSTHETLCSLLYDKCFIELRGRGVALLIGLLKFYQMRFVQRFDPEMYLSASGHEPLIDRIRYRIPLRGGVETAFTEHQTDSPLIRME